MNDQSTTDTDILIRAEDVTKNYPDGDVPALRGVSLSVRRGEYVVIMGPSGSGKSTLLNLLGALDTPSSGEVYFEERSITSIHPLSKLRSDKIGFVFQSFHLIPTLTAVENVQIPMFVKGWSAHRRTELATELIETVGMSHRVNHFPNKLSVGERQRVALARALANDPVALLGDEPTGNLDTKTGNDVLDLFDRLHKQGGKTLVIITHSPEVALRADRVVHIRDGRIERED
ncbi:MAG: ABC transporter ATP-binding protein [Pirellulaceae bacterium]